MKNMCNVVKDLLPLYEETMVSEDTRTFVDEHLETCEDCQNSLAEIKSEIAVDENTEIVPLKNVKKAMNRKRTKIIFLSVLIPFVVIIVVLGYLTSPQYIQYNENIVKITPYGQGEKEFLRVSFDEDVTDYKIEKSYIENEYEKVNTYTITAWTTELDKLCEKSVYGTTISLDHGVNTRVFYSSNNGQEDALIYDETLFSGGVITLPRLVLGYYLLIAIVVAAVLGVLLLIFFKKVKVRRVLEKIFFLPVSYIIGHLCIMLFSTVSYSAMFDFFKILIITLPIYFILIIITSLAESKAD